MKMLKFILVIVVFLISALLGTIIGYFGSTAMVDRFEFLEGDRYFPEFMVQYSSPVFLWDDFTSYRTELWGNNQRGNISILKLERKDHRADTLPDGKLMLKNKEMIWLLKRLSYGQLEFRWSGLGERVKGADKFLGFGDPNEGYAAGFRLHDLGFGEGVQLYATTVNHGQSFRTKIPWKKDYATSTRFIIVWMPDRVEYIAVTAEKYEKVAVHKDSDLPGIGLPRIRMEISIQNFAGETPLIIDLVKYDAF